MRLALRGPTLLAAFTALAACAAVGAPLTAPLYAQGSRDDRDDRRAVCPDSWESDDDMERFCEVRETRLRASGGRITIDGRENGGARVRGWDGDSVLVRAIIQTRGESEQEAAALAKEVRVQTAGGTIRADGPANRRRASWWVSYQVFVPRRTDLTVDTHNGPISVRDVSGKMQLNAVNGPLTLTRVGGDVRGRTRNGPLNVELAGSKWEGVGLDAETSNGPVTLSIPENYSGHLVTGTTNGPMRIDFPVTVQGRIGRRLETDLGSGGPPIRAITTNGPLVVRRS